MSQILFLKPSISWTLKTAFWVELCADCRAQADSNPEMYLYKPHKKKTRVHEFVEFQRRGDDVPDELLDTVLT